MEPGPSALGWGPNRPVVQGRLALFAHLPLAEHGFERREILMSETERPGDSMLSLLLFSGTDDKLSSAALLTAGAAAMGRKVHIMLQYWAIDSFRKGGTLKDHGVAVEAGPEGEKLFRRSVQPGTHWSEILDQARQIGEVEIFACAASMEMLGLTQEDLDPIVGGIEGVATFIGQADGQVIFI